MAPKGSKDDAKVHLYDESGCRYIGTLCCRADDIFQTGGSIDPTVNIKRYAPSSAVGDGYQKLPMFLRRKTAFASPKDETAHYKMLEGLRSFLERLHNRGECAVLSNDQILSPSGETYNGEPGVFLLLRIPTPCSPRPVPDSDGHGGHSKPQTAPPTPSAFSPIGTVRELTGPAPPAMHRSQQHRLPLPGQQNECRPPRENGTGQGVNLGARGACLSLPSNAQQVNGQARGNAGMGARGDRIFSGLSPEGEKGSASFEGKSGGRAHLENTAARLHKTRFREPRGDARGNAGVGARGSRGVSGSSSGSEGSRTSGGGRGVAGASAEGHGAHIPLRGNGDVGRPTRVMHHDIGEYGGCPEQADGGTNGAVGGSPSSHPGGAGRQATSTDRRTIQHGGNNGRGSWRALGGGGPSGAIVGTLPAPHRMLSASQARATTEPSPQGEASIGSGPRNSTLGEGVVYRGCVWNNANDVGCGVNMDGSYFLSLVDKAHTSPFHAAAELIHNSSGAQATEVRVSLQDLGPEKDTNFVVLDDGCGMTHAEMAGMLAWGRYDNPSSNALNGERIRCSRVGFKQGALYLGDTVVVISVRGKAPSPDLPAEHAPTASFGILSVEGYRRSCASEVEHRPVVLKQATLNLQTMLADERYNRQEEYDAVMSTICGLVPYFTREFLVARVARFVRRRADGSPWGICDVKSSTSIFISRLRTDRYSLVTDHGGKDILLKDNNQEIFRLPHRPKSFDNEPRPMEYSLRSFCKKMFLGPKMKIYVEGCEVNAGGTLPSPRKKQKFGIVERQGRISSSPDSLPPDNMTVKVCHDVWQLEDNLHAFESTPEAVAQVLQGFSAPTEVRLKDGEDRPDSVPKESYDAHEAKMSPCRVKGIPVPTPQKKSRWSTQCDYEDSEKEHGRTVSYGPSAKLTRTEAAPEVFSSDVRVKKKKTLGKGTSAPVFSGLGDEGRDDSLKSKVLKIEDTRKRDKDILWKLARTGESHPNVCRLVWVCKNELTLALKQLWPNSCSLSEMMDGNESRHLLTNHVKFAIAEKIAGALRHLHRRKFSHNDVQPSNIVLGPNPKHDILLVDFGEACSFETQGAPSIKPRLRYAPPELLTGGAMGGGECDIFGFGLTMVELFAGQPLFGVEVVRDEAKLKNSLVKLRNIEDLTRSPADLLERQRALLPGLVSLFSKAGVKELARIFRGCVHGDPRTRLTSDDVLQRLEKLRDRATFHWRHGTSIVYHTLEPEDKLHFSDDGRFFRLSRLPSHSSRRVALGDHVKHGSKLAFRSKYISCSLSLSYCIFCSQKQQSMSATKSFGLAPILEIDLSKLGCAKFDDHVFDRTKRGRGGDEATIGEMVEDFSGAADEVILGVDVPGAAVKAVYNFGFTERPVTSPSRRLHAAVSQHAAGPSPKFSVWERHYNTFVRPKGHRTGRSMEQQILDETRVPNEMGRIEGILRASYWVHQEERGGSLSNGGRGRRPEGNRGSDGQHHRSGGGRGGGGGPWVPTTAARPRGCVEEVQSEGNVFWRPGTQSFQSGSRDGQRGEVERWVPGPAAPRRVGVEDVQREGNQWGAAAFKDL